MKGAKALFCLLFTLHVIEVRLSVTPDRPRPPTLLPPRSYGKPEAAAAVDRLLMMGMRMPETC